ncbi:hypothetical protein EU527_05835 [Candidatus Thorarchaeota archaeon]|nr:MAG: hypothetical protein EU527_05835 [Candidatus Thorarchaeota archaeon]
MNKSNRDNSLFQELERADSALTKVLEKLIVINDSLKPVLRELRVIDFSSSGIFKRGIANGIICSVTSLIRGDPLSKSLEAQQGKGLEIPSIIMAADRNESRNTCDSILKIIESEFLKKTPRFIINLRWGSMPKILNPHNILVIGRRYSNLEEQELKKLTTNLEQQGLRVYEDSGEYGGGLLIYHLLESVGKTGNTTVFEITLSKELAENEKQVGFILQAFSTI